MTSRIQVLLHKFMGNTCGIFPVFLIIIFYRKMRFYSVIKSHNCVLNKGTTRRCGWL